MIRFLADAMLGKLVRWLRILGYDTVYSPQSQDCDLIESALLDDRTLLTRDVALHKAAIRRGVTSIFVNSTSIKGQLAELSPPISFSLSESRCPLCNGSLIAADRDDANIPRQSPPSRGTLWRCTHCGKIYWNGRHWDTITETIADLSR